MRAGAFRTLGIWNHVRLIDPIFRGAGGVDYIVDFQRSQSINRFPVSVITSIHRAIPDSLSHTHAQAFVTRIGSIIRRFL